MKIVSFFPGRIRICSSVFKSEQVLESVRERLEKMDGIREFSGNARTGSVTIAYCPKTISSDMLVEAKEELERMESELLAG